MEYDIAQKSLLGAREEQQDCHYAHCEPGRAFAVVCDGMGGIGHGGAASRVAVETLKGLFYAKEAAESCPTFFIRAVDILDEQVANLADDLGQRLGGGTTIVAVIIEGDALYWLSVGDSRLYILRGEELVCVTRDHNYLLIEPEDTSRKAEALISFIGMPRRRMTCATHHGSHGQKRCPFEADLEPVFTSVLTAYGRGRF